MGKILKFERKQKATFEAKVAAEILEELAVHIRHDELDPPTDLMFTIFRQGDEWIIGGHGLLRRADTVKLITSLRKYFINIEI